MEYTEQFQYEAIGDNEAVSKIVENIMKSLIGTTFVERDKLEKLMNEYSIGRTYFADRIKMQNPVNASFITKFRYICTYVLNGDSFYNSETASIMLNKFFIEYLNLRTDFLCFYNDDGDILRSAKINGWIQLLTDLFTGVKDAATISRDEILVFLDPTMKNLFEMIKKNSINTYTERIIRGIEVEERCSDTLTDNCEKEYRKFSFDQIYKEYCYEFEERYPKLNSVISEHGIPEFIVKVMESFNNEHIKRNTRKNIASGVIASILRAACLFDKQEKITPDKKIMPSEDSIACLEHDIAISIQLLLSLSKADSFTELSRLSNKAFFRRDICESERDAIAFAVLCIFFTDLFLIVTRYPEEHADMIRYKTNADVCQELSLFSRHVSFQSSPVVMDTPKRRIDICLSCDKANAHKAAALFINEFERALSGFEDIFAQLDLQLYYMRASVSPFGQDNVTNHNFEAYTPTLMPLLSGGHLYNSNLVFIRELVQNSIDSISVRKFVQRDCFDMEVNVVLSADITTGQVSSIIFQDCGMGMGRREIERYLTSIGRSYYTARDFKKLNLAYHPISSFGIGFLSCFLVCQVINISTHSIVNDKSYRLSIPNIEGCFFIEESDDDLPYGTSIHMDMGEVSSVNIFNLLEYAWIHFLDVGYKLSFSWDEDTMVIMRLEDANKSHPKITNTDIAHYARQQTQPPPCPFSFVDDGVLLPTEKASEFQHHWWNRYIRNQYDGIELVKYGKQISSFSITPHSARRPGEKFFLFLPFQADGDVTFYPFGTIKETFIYDYGMFITDLPLAGLKIRARENGLKPYSGKLRILNAGILVDDASLESIFGENMRIYTNDQEAAYNDVIINFPPDWIELNVAREKIVRISPTSVNKQKFLLGIASSAVDALNYFIDQAKEIPMVNIQEIASFITVVCNDLNNEDTGRGRKLLTELKKKKFLLKISAEADGIRYEMVEDNGEDMNMKSWFEANLTRIRENKYIREHVPTEDFFHDFELQLGKKRVTEIEEINDGLAEQYHLPKSYIDTLRHDVALVAFATYICYFPESRIARYSTKAAHSRLALERQLMKKYSVADFSNGDMQWSVTYGEMADFSDILRQVSITRKIFER